MKSTMVSSTGSVKVQKSYLKIETLCCKNPTEIHNAIRGMGGEVGGELTADRSIVG